MNAPAPQPHNAIRPEWLAATREEVLDPQQPIIDAHHHLLDRPGTRYLFDELLADLASGHDVRATVHVQARSMLRADGPEAMRPVGETEFANGVAAMFASGGYGKARACAAIVGYVDLHLGDAVRPVLEAHIAAAGGTAATGGRFRGLRHLTSWDADAALFNPAYPTTEHMMEDPGFRKGLAQLAPLGLSFDAWVFFPQLRQLAALANAFADTVIIVNHCGGIAGIGSYAGRRGEVFQQWRAGLRELAACPNVFMKVGGLGMRLSGFGFEHLARAPSSQQLADAWRPWMEGCIEAFGAARCMFESNSPVDQGSYGYAVGWNALKRIAAGASADEKNALFWGTAARAYRLPPL